jgi:tagatose 6-phosphate kinase
MARAAVRLGGKVLSAGIVGGTAGRFVERELAREGIGHELVWTDIETRRLSTLYVEGESDTTVVLEPGQAVGDDVREAFTQCVLRNAWRAPYVALIGSLPPDFPSDYYASLVQQLKALGANVCLDSTALHLKSAAVFGPTLIKVNREEFGRAFAESCKTFDWGLVQRTYAQLREKGVRALIVTDGPRGAFVFSEPPPIFG